MKKVLFLIAAFVAVFSTVNAQIDVTATNPNFAKGQIDVNAGIGLLRTFYSGHSTAVPPISISADYGITDKISVGGFLGYTSTKDRYFYDATDFVKYSFTIIGVRGAYHLNLWDKMDTYGGLMLGYNIASSKVTSSSPYWDDYSVAASGLALSAYVGGRYHFTEQIGAFAEVGYGISVLNLGATVRF